VRVKNWLLPENDIFIAVCQGGFPERPASAAWFIFKTNRSENPPLIIRIRKFFCLDSGGHYRYST
jgi:hypothetical protein